MLERMDVQVAEEDLQSADVLPTAQRTAKQHGLF